MTRDHYDLRYITHYIITIWTQRLQYTSSFLLVHHRFVYLVIYLEKNWKNTLLGSDMEAWFKIYILAIWQLETSVYIVIV